MNDIEWKNGKKFILSKYVIVHYDTIPEDASYPEGHQTPLVFGKDQVADIWGRVELGDGRLERNDAGLIDVLNSYHSRFMAICLDRVKYLCSISSLTGDPQFYPVQVVKRTVLFVLERDRKGYKLV